MNEKFQEELIPLLQELVGLDELNAVLMIQKIVELADLHQDHEMSLQWRQELFGAAHRAGMLEYEFAAFDGIVARYDREPGDRALLGWILWHYKWLAEHVCEFPQASRQRIDALFADMTSRYEAAGIGLRPVFAYRCRRWAFMGHSAAAAEDYDRWQTAARGEQDDCRACETHSRVVYLLESGDLPGALKAAEPILRGRQSCSEVPATTYSILLLPLVEDGKLAEAARLHAAVYRQVRGQDDLLAYLPHHLAYAAVVGDKAKAKTILSRLPKGLDSRNGWRRFLWFRAASVAADRLSQGGKGLKLDLKEEDSPVPDSDGRVDLSELSQWLWQQAVDLADQFNRRNGTTLFSDLLAAGQRWKTLLPIETGGGE
jgi:cellulose synthase operon protein C